VAKSEHTMIEAAGREVRLSNPAKVYFPKPGWTKLDLATYYIDVAEAALVHLRERPTVMKRFVNGIREEPIWQKRVPQNVPEWLQTATVSFPSGRTAEELVANDAAHMVWAVNLGVIDFNPWPARRDDLDHPDELRVDLDPTPGITWDAVRRTAMVVRDVLSEHGLRGYPKTSGSKGIHVNVRIEQRWDFLEVRRAALALAREVERRAPDLATSKWWKEERHGVFVDYNQNAKDRTVASAYSVRPRPDARVSAPLAWDEVDECEPADFTLRTMPARFASIGDRHAGIDDHPGDLSALLELSARDERDGLGDAPWPPQYKKQPGEPPRVQPSRRRKPAQAPAPSPEPELESAAPPAPPKRRSATGRRTSKHPLIEIGRAEKKDDALAGLERWKARHPAAAAHLEPADVLVDAMRGRFHTWTRIRVNLQHVPAELRPPQEPLDHDSGPTMWGPFSGADGPPRRPSRARKVS
jgi:bifunctional non-homologous end joining protein LigD